jgi:hypothetical protein
MGYGRVDDNLRWLDNRREQSERIDRIINDWREDMEQARNLLIEYFNGHALFRTPEKVGETEINVDMRRPDGSWTRVTLEVKLNAR